jgi:hypothetical protein
MAVYERFNHIFQMLDEAMDLTYDIDSTPFNVGRIQFLMARASSEINILDLVISQLEEGVSKALMPPEVRLLLVVRKVVAVSLLVSGRPLRFRCCFKRSAESR